MYKVCLLLDKYLDSMCCTKTWHQPNVLSFLNETCPPSYCYLQKAHSKGHGGGLAVIYHSHLDLSPLPPPELSSFESLAFKCKSSFPMTILVVYQPPNPHSSFISEMYNLLPTFCTTSANIIYLEIGTFTSTLPPVILLLNFCKYWTVLISNMLMSSHTQQAVHTLVDFYIENLTSILVLHAPVKVRTVTFTRSAPWFTSCRK